MRKTRSSRPIDRIGPTPEISATGKLQTEAFISIEWAAHFAIAMKNRIAIESGCSSKRLSNF